ncbi:FHA domain-containing protein [Nocardia macrotermitis]|uniref:FHA domain-containing protein n=1 Tax=Nocardia macrotermitis TaxID=2585198 RepID=A0A7K0D024_9NOCA|nr:FHA domain-containing protein [Nocardia macrotermitis]MQY19060.1 hypothetical protein [Nocardia macrotermitis]
MRDRQVEVVPGNHVVVRVAGALVLVAHRGSGPVREESVAMRVAEALSQLVFEATEQAPGGPGRLVAREATTWLMRDAEQISPDMPVDLGILTQSETGGIAIFLHGAVTAMLVDTDDVEYFHGEEAGFAVDRVAPTPARAAAIFVEEQSADDPELPERGIGALGEGVAQASGAVVWFEGRRSRARDRDGEPGGQRRSVSTGSMPFAGEPQAFSDPRTAPPSGVGPSDDSAPQLPGVGVAAGFGPPSLPGGGAPGDFGPSLLPGTGVPGDFGPPPLPGSGTPGDFSPPPLPGTGAPGDYGPPPLPGTDVPGDFGPSPLSSPGVPGDFGPSQLPGSGTPGDFGPPPLPNVAQVGEYDSAPSSSPLPNTGIDNALVPPPLPGGGGNFAPSSPTPPPLPLVPPPNTGPDMAARMAQTQLGRPSSVPPQADPEPMPDRGGAPGVRVVGFKCARAHPSDPRSAFCTVCGMPVDQTQPPSDVVRPPLGVLVLDDGSMFTVAADAVLGRDPQHSEAAQRGMVPIKLEDNSGGMSRAHAEIRLVNWDATIVDRGSTNGTRARLPGYPDWMQLVPNQPMAMPHGTEIMLGNRVLRYDPVAIPPFG